MGYQQFYLPTHRVSDLATRLGYRKRRVSVIVVNEVTLTGLNWSGGSISKYHGINLRDMSILSPDHSRHHPALNAAEGQTVPIPDDMMIAKTGTFQGKPSLMTLFVRPDNIPRYLTEGK